MDTTSNSTALALGALTALSIVLYIGNVTGGTTSIENIRIQTDTSEMTVYNFMDDGGEKWPYGFKEGYKIDGHSSSAFKYSVSSKDQEMSDNLRRLCTIQTSGGKEYKCQLEPGIMTSKSTTTYSIASAY